MDFEMWMNESIGVSVLKKNKKCNKSNNKKKRKN